MGTICWRLTFGGSQEVGLTCCGTVMSPLELEDEPELGPMEIEGTNLLASKE